MPKIIVIGHLLLKLF